MTVSKSSAGKLVILKSSMTLRHFIVMEKQQAGLSCLPPHASPSPEHTHTNQTSYLQLVCEAWATNRLPAVTSDCARSHPDTTVLRNQSRRGWEGMTQQNRGPSPLCAGKCTLIDLEFCFNVGHF